MFANLNECKKYCQENGIKAIDFKLINLAGRWHHLTIPVERLDQQILDDGIGFDGSSYGFLTLEKSDMVFLPDFSSAFVDPFCEIPTLSIISNIYRLDGNKMVRFEGDPALYCGESGKILKDYRHCRSDLLWPGI
ncbi:MAG: glutamine synthetase [Peptococcia bacterium]